MEIVQNTITIKELKKMASKMFGNLVKAVVDVKRGILIVDANLHSDQEAFLLEQGSKQSDLWGINIYPNENEDKWIEFDSMINIRPNDKNPTRDVESQAIKQEIIKIVRAKIKNEIS